MKRILFGLVLGLAAVAAAAQEATLTVPVTRTSEAKIIVDRLTLDRAGPTVLVETLLRDSADGDIRRVNYVVPDSAHAGATVAGFVTAMFTVRAGEAGSNPRKLNFRVLGYLADNGYFPAHTLVP